MSYHEYTKLTRVERRLSKEKSQLSASEIFAALNDFPVTLLKPLQANMILAIIIFVITQYQPEVDPIEYFIPCQ